MTPRAFAPRVTRSRSAGLVLAGIGALVLSAAAAAQPTTTGCAPGTRCLRVRADGRPSSGGASVAQCSAFFPDFIVERTRIPAGHQGPWFKLAQAYPAALPPAGDQPWKAIDFKASAAQATLYLHALRDYAFDGMLEAEFDPARNARRAWFHVPLMNFGNGRREPLRGLTQERPLRSPALGLQPGARVDNFAIGFYSERGAFAIGQVWKNPAVPNPAAARFAEGTVVFKILFSAARPEDFASTDTLEDAPAWEVAVGNGQKRSVRLLQMDVAVRDDRATETGWVYGTFAYERTATDPVAWRRLRAVALMWGNDPGKTPGNTSPAQPLQQTFVSAEIPQYARALLGWAGRANGPVDNPLSACLSCHSTAQFPTNRDMVPPNQPCNTNDEKLLWFRNLAPAQAFGVIDGQCRLTSAQPAPVSLDTSLQAAVALRYQLEDGRTNPCLAQPPAAKPKKGGPLER